MDSFFSATDQQNGSAYRPPPFTDPDMQREVPALALIAPTGAGKTLMSTAVLSGLTSFNDTKLGPARLLLWCVPTKTLVDQTTRSLRDPRGRYARQLNRDFSSFKVMTIEQALQLKKHQLRDGLTIVVGTLAAFRRSDRNALRVYRENGNLIDFFDHLSPSEKAGLLSPNLLAGTEWKGGEGEELSSFGDDQPIPSLVNVFRLHRAPMVIDESHRSQSSLSWDVISDLRPRIVFEMTATPKPGANILVRVGVTEMKQEEMVRLPLNLYPAPGWMDAISNAQKQRRKLEDIAAQAGERVRPIVLLQAETAAHDESSLQNGQVSIFDAVEFMTSTLGIDRKEIAIKTGKVDELAGVDLLAPDCPIRYVLTQKAAAEGWDCPYAMVLCTLAASKSKVQVEQLIGRCIRQDQGKRSSQPELNQTYVYSATTDFTVTASSVIEAMKVNGFEEKDVVTHDEDSSSGSIRAKDVARLKPEFSNLRKTLLGLKVSATQTRVIENSTQLVQVAENNGVFISTDPVKNILSKPQEASTKKILDIEDGEITETDVALLDGELSDDHDEFSSRQLSNNLAKTVRLKEVDHGTIAPICHKTVKEEFVEKGWANGQIQACYGDVQQMLLSGVERRYREVAKEGMRIAMEENKVVLESRSLAKELIHEIGDQSVPHSKHVYDLLGPMNAEEKKIARVLEASSRVKAWQRLVEGTPGALYLPTSRGRFYPDFCAWLDDGTFVILEYKGEQLTGNEDSEEKLRIGRDYAKVAGGGTFFMVSNAQAAEQGDQMLTTKQLEQHLA